MSPCVTRSYQLSTWSLVIVARCNCVCSPAHRRPPSPTSPSLSAPPNPSLSELHSCDRRGDGGMSEVWGTLKQMSQCRWRTREKSKGRKPRHELKKKRRQEHLCGNFKQPLKGKMRFRSGFSGLVNNWVLFWPSVGVCVFE